jgi:hypothetical protein
MRQNCPRGRTLLDRQIGLDCTLRQLCRYMYRDPVSRHMAKCSTNWRLQASIGWVGILARIWLFFKVEGPHRPWSLVPITWSCT